MIFLLTNVKGGNQLNTMYLSNGYSLGVIL